MGRLSPEDIRILMEDPSPASRERIVEKVSLQYGQDSLTDNEKKVAVEIFLLVLGDSEPSVRRTMAEGLKSCDFAPSHVMKVLAEDKEDDIAVPVIKESLVLGEQELLDIIRSTNMPVRLVAVAERKDVSELISEKLIEKKIEEVVLRLLENGDARIGDKSYNAVADDYYNNQSILQAMIRRKPMPSQAVKRCVNNAMDSARHSMQAHQLSKLAANDQDSKDEALRQSTIKARKMVRELQVLGKNPSPYECERLVLEMTKLGRLTTEMLLTALCLGHLRFFAAAMAKRASITFEKSGTVCSTPTEPIFKALYEKAHMPTPLMSSVIWLLERAIERLVDGMEPNKDETAIKMATELQTAMVAGIIPFSESISKLTVGLIQLGNQK